MGYDIGIGICTAIDAAQVTVKLDSAMVSKLVPGRPWKRSGTSLLHLPSDLCSARKPPEVGSEIYLGRDRLGARAQASLDINGDGRVKTVDLRQLLQDLDPNPAPRAGTARSGKR